MKILIAHDGSSCSDQALDDLARAGLPAQAQALIISVAEVHFLPPASSYEIFGSPNFEWVDQELEVVNPPHKVEEARSVAVRASDKVKTLFPGWTISTNECCGSPAGEIIEQAEKWNADLIVVGSRSRSKLDRFLLGSVAQRVVTEAHCSVRVARTLRSDMDSPVRILLGLDGSTSCAAAIKAIGERGWPKGSKVRLVTSIDSWGEPGAKAVDKYAGARHIQKFAETYLCARGLDVSSVVKEVDAKHLLVEEAESWDADTVFVGAKGLGRLRRLLLGSVSTAVVSRAHCTVEVVRLPNTN